VGQDVSRNLVVLLSKPGSPTSLPTASIMRCSFCSKFPLLSMQKCCGCPSHAFWVFASMSFASATVSDRAALLAVV
jgi:hypothetical protein